MSFYQQKYFKPYQQVISSPDKYKNFRQRQFKTPQTIKKYSKNYANSNKIMVAPIWENLYTEGLKSQRQLMEKHEQTKHRIDVQCTFTPMIKQNKRYLVPSHSTFLQRNAVWAQNRIQKLIKQKQEETNKGLKQCTFSPHINKKSKGVISNKYEYSMHKKNCPNQKQKQKNKNKTITQISRYRNQENIDFQETSKHKKGNYVKMNQAKDLIRNELKRLAL